MKSTINQYTIFGMLTYSSYGIGLFFPSVVGLSIIPVFILVILLFTNRRNLVNKWLFNFTFLFIGWYLLSYFWFDTNDYGTYKSIMLATKAVPLILIPCIVSRYMSSFLCGIWLMLFLFLLAVSLMTLTNISSINIHSRIEFGIFNPIWISRAVLECLLLSILVLKLRTRVITLIVILSIVVIYASGSKGPILSFCISLFFWYMSRLKSAKQKLHFKIFCGCALIAVLLAVGSLSKDSYLYQRFLTSVPEGSSDEVIEHSRVVVWPNTFDRLLEQPFLNFLLGNGPGSFPTFYYGQHSNIRMYPHNSILEVIIENGFFVFIIIVSFFVYAYKKTSSSLKYIFLFAVFNSFFSGDLLLNEYIFLYLSLFINDFSRNKTGLLIRRF